MIFIVGEQSTFSGMVTETGAAPPLAVTVKITL